MPPRTKPYEWRVIKRPNEEAYIDIPDDVYDPFRLFEIAETLVEMGKVLTRITQMEISQ